mmetsp:Transcript_7164/g.13138  ORF Transcript_7164/g.13138 Transcript_7164/m.13138 type:complete len:257 (-) Transcript_7164:1167-1937(-)
MVIVAAISSVLTACSNERVRLKATSILEGYAFNSWYMLVIQSYLDLLIPSSIQLLYYREGPWFEYVVGFCVFVRLKQSCCMLMVPLTSLLIVVNKDSIGKGGAHWTFSALYEEFKNDKGLLSMLYYPLLLVKKIIYVGSMLLLSDRPVLLIAVCAMCSLQSFVYVLYLAPFKTRVMQSLALYYEGCILFALIILSVFLTGVNESAVYAYSLLVKLLVSSIFASSIGWQLQGIYLKVKSLMRRLMYKLRVRTTISLL